MFMGSVIDFQDRAVATLRARVAQVEEANQDLIAFARGHSGAVAAIHGAVLAAIEADGFEHLIHVVTQDWPDILGVDAVGLALHAGDTALCADGSGLQFVEPRVIARAMQGIEGVVLRGVEQGHPLFGPASPLIRTEALVRFGQPAPSPGGLVVLGQRSEQRLETRHGSELLGFLGSVLAHMVARWPHP
jgi:uncharacterized protein